MRKAICLLIVLFSTAIAGKAQLDSIHYYGQVYYAGASNNLLPHWISSNRYGIFDYTNKNDGLLLMGVAMPVKIGSKFKLDTRVDVLLKPETSQSYLHQIFVNAHYGKLQMKIGKEAYTLTDYNEKLSSGSFFYSNNARPMPKIGIGFYQYTTVPFTKGYLEFKAIFNVGKLDDNRGPDGVDEPLFHEKFLYLRTAKLLVNPHIGLNHNSIFGGTKPDGTKIPIDILATIFARPSSKLGGGEEINVAGAHFGLYDFGLDWDLWGAHFQFYLQKPFEDGSGERLINNRDEIFGLNVQRNGKQMITGFLYELVDTKFQSGAGIPDPIVNGKLVKLSEIDNLDQFMLENFDTITSGITPKQVGQYLTQNLNFGHQYGGRDDYYNNYLYPRGLSYYQYSIGTPLFLTRDRVKTFNPDLNAVYDEYFVSNRVVAHHFGIEGWIRDNLHYRGLITYTNNFGTYSGLNKGRYNWASMDPNTDYQYYFKDGLKEIYSLIEINYTPVKLNGWEFIGALAYDFGEMYNDFGIMLSLKYSNELTLRKKEKK